MRLSFMDAYKCGKLIAPFVFTGMCNHFVMEAWIEHILIPVLNHGDHVIMDNASFHKNARIRELIESAGCSLIFLPVRSPDFNPIEHCWPCIKNEMCKLLPKHNRDMMLCAEILVKNNNSGLFI